MSGIYRPCGERLWRDGRIVAICTHPFGTEHHHEGADESIVAGCARPATAADLSFKSQVNFYYHGDLVHAWETVGAPDHLSMAEAVFATGLVEDGDAIHFRLYTENEPIPIDEGELRYA